jgi:small subunit ribosomal protein S1
MKEGKNLEKKDDIKEELSQKKEPENNFLKHLEQLEKSFNKKNVKMTDQIIRKNIQNETLFMKEVIGIQRDPEYKDVMMVDFDGLWGIIPIEEADCDYNVKSLVPFIGRKVPLIITEYDKEKGRLVCSRKKAQNYIKSKLITEFSQGNVVSGKIVKINRFGAIVEICGISGYLKNENFSDDHISVGDVFSVGETIKVQLFSVNENDKITFKVPQLYKKKNIPAVDNFEEGQIVKGRVISVKDWGFYVRLLPGIDALCPLPKNEEVLIGSKVAVKLTRIFDENKKLRMRGRLIKFLV